MFRRLALGAAALLALGMTATNAAADPPTTPLSGAIFTTDASGDPVNLNIYDAKEDVYLNGGPGINAPDDAAGLPAGDYYFQVTDPSGRTLLSEDPVECRMVTVDESGVITAVGTGACAHLTGTSTEDGGLSVQLYPFLDTPNNGGVYKVWITPVDEYEPGARGTRFGFYPHHSKTDNFKVRAGAVVEIDVRFQRDDSPNPLLGKMAEKTDTLGASNTKFSEYDPAVLAFYEAHFEAVEPGTHHVTVSDQPECVVDHVHGPDGKLYLPSGGSVTVPVQVKNHNAGDVTYWVDVHCH